ncbi:MAG: hypothetical protein JXX28_16535, partial [Deltaproteobacteria bacterium]|nr:hypothetical protein [Deltaproteobacteria bacterium]
DTDGDGHPEQLSTWDEEGELSSVEEDPDGDGTYEQTYAYGCAWSEDGLVQTCTTEEDGSMVRIATYTWNELGAPVSQIIDELDFRGNWKRDTITWAYDSQDRLIEYSWAFDIGTARLGRVTYTYSADGLTVSELDDWDGDGVPDKLLTETRDAQGRLVEDIWDQPVDGILDSGHTYAWHPDGTLWQERYLWYDDTGALGEVYLQEYHPDGYLTLIEVSRDRLLTRSWFDAQGSQTVFQLILPEFDLDLTLDVPDSEGREGWVHLNGDMLHTGRAGTGWGRAPLELSPEGIRWHPGPIFNIDLDDLVSCFEDGSPQLVKAPDWQGRPYQHTEYFRSGHYRGDTYTDYDGSTMKLTGAISSDARGWRGTRKTCTFEWIPGLGEEQLCFTGPVDEVWSCP